MIPGFNEGVISRCNKGVITRFNDGVIPRFNNWVIPRDAAPQKWNLTTERSLVSFSGCAMFVEGGVLLLFRR